MISLIAAALALTTQVPAQVPALPLPTKVVITVNGHPILAKEVEAYLWEWNASQVGDLLTILELLRQETVKQNVVVTPAEIQQKVAIQFQQLMARAPKGSNEDAVLKATHNSRSHMEALVKGQLMLEKLAGKLFNPNDFVRVATIIVRPKTDTAADKQVALAKANQAYAALQKGDAWEKVLPAYATEPQSIQNAGELGWRHEGQFPAATKLELDSVKLNGFTKPIETPGGYQIFRLENRGKDASPGELTEAKAQYVNVAEREIVTRLQREAKIVTSY